MSTIDEFRALLREFPDLTYTEVLEVHRLRNQDRITEQADKLRKLRSRG